MATNTNINFPQSEFLDPLTRRPAREWMLWLMSPSVISVNFANALGVTSGGTGLSTIPTDGQLLIGNGAGYTLDTLTPGAGIGVTNGVGSIAVANTGVLSWSGGVTGLTPAAATTGNVTLSGVLGAGYGGTGLSSYAIGDMIYASGATALARLAAGTAGQLLTSAGIGAPVWATLDLSSPPPIGNVTPNTGTFTTLIGGGGSANYGQLTGGATTKAVQFQTLGTDTNISMAFQPKGTGAIDLAAGSRGVNISNGGTVTALTRTSTGTAYTSIPSVAVSAPTTAGGVQATASANMFQLTIAIVGGGTGYTVNDVLTVVGGTGSASQITVSTVSAGVITSITPGPNSGLYSVLPTNPVSVTGGTGSSATFNILTYGVSTVSVGTAGSGYVEQPTVTFSGGGGSGAAAYATVGGTAKITVLAGTGEVWTASGRQLVVGQAATTPTTVWTLYNDSFARSLLVGSGTAGMSSGSTSNLSFFTNSTAQEQLRITHTASAINYVQVTGGASGGQPNISVQGSDAAIALQYKTKGNFFHQFQNGASQNCFEISPVASTANYVRATSAIATASPILSSQGTDTNIDLTLTPKGTGNVRFGTYTGTILTPTGYVEIKDSGGTVRRLLVG